VRLLDGRQLSLKSHLSVARFQHYLAIIASLYRTMGAQGSGEVYRGSAGVK